MEDRYILKYPDGSFVALDAASGGCPYRTKSFDVCHFWHSIADAVKYCGVMSEDGFTVHRVTFVVTPVHGDELSGVAVSGA